MPFSELQRSDSWPPTVIRVTPDEPEDIVAAIDENPFAYFLTSPEDIDEYLDEENLSAGIETPDSGKSPMREVSPSSLQRTKDHVKEEDEDDDDEDEVDFGIAIPRTLKELTMRHSSGRESRAGKRAEDNLKGLGIAIPARGRAKVRLVPSDSGRGRGRTRSLSARRPQSWREPSLDIWSIEEEEEEGAEEDNAGAKAMKNLEVPLSQSAPSTTKIGMGEMVKPKPKKRVHWAF